MNTHNLIQVTSRYQSDKDYHCEHYKFGFVYKRILSYVLEQNKWMNILEPAFQDVLKDIHSFSMRVISRAVTIYLNNLYKDSLNKVKDFQEFYSMYKKEFIADNKKFNEFFSIFPEAISILYNYYNQTLNNVEYLLQLLEENKSAIQQKFSISEAEYQLLSFDLSKGDKHENGRCTASVKIGKENFFVKWKDAKAEMNHQHLYEYLRECLHMNGPEVDLDILTLDQFYIQREIIVEDIDCVETYFKNVGIFLFTTYLISGSDFHYENIISTKDTIITIDSENIFNIKEDFTVYDTALLPSFSIREKTLAAFSNNFEGDLDILKYVYEITKKGIEVRKVIEKKGSVHLNIPKYKGEELIFYQYKNFIMEGFKKSYEFFLDNKLEMMNKMESLFTGIQNRIIKKHTYIYSDAIWSSYAPKLLTARKWREEFFRTLEIFEENEINFLLEGNIPSFRQEINIDPQYYHKFCMLDLKKQLQFIEEAYILEQVRSGSNPVSKNVSSHNGDLNDIFLHCYENLMQKSFYSENNRLNWLEIVEKGNDLYKDYQVDYMPDTLYYGKVGIYLYLLKYSQHFKMKTREENELQLQIRLFIEDFQKDIDNNPSMQNGIFDGAAGLLYLMVEFEKNNPSYKEEIIKTIEKLGRNVSHDLSFDIVSGSVGLLKALLDIYHAERFKNYRHILKENIILVKNHLVTNYYKQNNVSGWLAKEKSGIDISFGYSHGIAGYLPVLFQCAKLLDDQELFRIVDDCLEFLNSANNSTTKNWPCSIQNKKELDNWCHGAPGILLSLTELLNEGYAKGNLKEVIYHNLSTLEQSEKQSLSLCHGKFGNYFIGIYIAYSLKDEVLYNKFMKKLEDGLTSYFSVDDINGMNKSFMTGYSGILFMYLLFLEKNIIRSNNVLLAQ
ncbi:lanthionine synthetase LanC family protein [Bacillus massilinigeriensis]|uniref:lanthionine synthetase LanC family protein n=1 Tax=Bacillus mediterraneensis TaxID=1805474 RepID=UPI0008F81518|nr:lanthionine synthetase LanC family protein [Bacillus mediterraneensis]